MRIVVTIMIMAVATSRVTATNYYLSSKGNDSQNGTSVLAPWRTLKKLSSAVQLLQPGDSVLFERGSVFAGELKIPASGKLGNEVYVGAYGLGAKPIISGSIKLDNWILFRGNIWAVDCKECGEGPGNLFIDDQFQPLGRYPNEGYLALSCNSQCKTSLTDNQHTFPDGYWDDSEVVVKSSRWTLDNLPVTNYFNKTFYFSTPPSYPLPNGYGYFIQKNLATLDKPGEWFFDKASKKIFLYFRANDNPGNHVVEVSAVDTGLNMTNANFVTIENITFKYQRVSAVQISYSNNISLRNCAIEYAGNNGMEVISCKRPTVENCRIEDSNNNGVEWKDNSNGSFLRNLVRRTGLHPGRGMSGNGTYIGLSISANHPVGNKNLIQYNSFDSTGYIGIDFRTGGTLIKNNLVSNFCMTKDDGAGIYTWHNSYGNNAIDGNIILHGTGCAEGTNSSDQVWAYGIYADDRSSDITIADNSVAYCGTSGIYVHNAKRISIHGNTLFANGTHPGNRENSQLCIKLDNIVPDGDKDLQLHIEENRFVTTQEDNHCVYLQAEKEQDLKTVGSFARNLYSTTAENQVVAKFYGRQDVCYAVEEFTLLDWQRCTDNEVGSQFKLIEGGPNGSTGSNLIKNSLMRNGTEGWIAWPSQVSIAHDKRKGVDEPSLRLQFPSGGYEGLLYQAGIRLSRNKMYRLSFSAMSAVKSKIEFAPLMASSPWTALDDYTCFSIDTVFKSFSYFFKPNMSSNDARVNFKSNATFWIDNVTLVEVVNPGAQGPVQFLYNMGEKPKAFSFSEKFDDMDGNQLSAPPTLQGYSSILLLKHK